MMSRLVKVEGNWIWLRFTTEEISAFTALHRQEALDTMKRCITDAMSIVSEVGIEKESFIPQLVREVVSSLFDKRCKNITAFLMTELDNAASELVKKAAEKKKGAS